jgi:hypothetical protein
LDLSDQTTSQLLLLHTEVADELRKRGITRNSNNPTGDLAEYLFCEAFQWIERTTRVPISMPSGVMGAGIK